MGREEGKEKQGQDAGNRDQWGGGPEAVNKDTQGVKNPSANPTPT